MKKQAVTHGFTLRESKEIAEIKATANMYHHEKSGAQLIHLAADDTNKVFCIAFKTIPEDSTGCPHILEHSVLNGSRNFPAKSTFMELIKGSLHTFINAMTASDMTLYPVASTNDQDFMNLTRVYMDAVLYPNIYTQPEILHQEGWHYELSSPEDELKVRGVVYNEMKGAFSSPDMIVYRHCQAAQFPDTAYGLESGGDPEVIPELSYEAFLAFHKKYYHPSNSRIFVYGDMDIDKVLELLDGDYLSKFEDDGIKIEMPEQKAFSKVQRSEVEYPVDETQDITDQYYLSLAYTYGKVNDIATTTALGVLVELLMHTPASPLKKAIMESGLALDSSAYVMPDILQPTISIVGKKVKKENIPAFEKLIETELKRIVSEGFDKKLIEGVLNSREFMLREGQMQNFPKGLYYAWVSYGNWMHGGDPIRMLGFEPLLQELRRGLTEPYFETLIEKALLKNKHASVTTFVPVPGLVAQKDAALKEKLAARKAKMSSAEIEELVAFNKALLEWQNAPENREDVERIPVLNLSDINPKAAEYPCEEEIWKEFTLLRHHVNTNGIVYLKAYFDLSHAQEGDMPWLSMYAYMTGLVDSQNHSYAELSNEIDIHTGGIDLRFSLMNSYQDPDEIMPKFVVSGKAVVPKSAKLMELAAELALKPVFTDVTRVKNLIRELKTRTESAMMSGGVSVAINRMFAPFSRIHRWSDEATGLAFYHFLCDLMPRLDGDIDAIIGELERVRQSFFSQNKLIISLTALPEEIDEAFQYLKPVVADIANTPYEAVDHPFVTLNVNEGIYAPVQVQFCAKGGNFFRKGFSYSGKMRVLNNILRTEYLYKELRVKGGAYGAMSNFSLAGYQYFCSYRDPNLKETLNAYDGVPDYLRSFDCDKREMDKFIIGDVSALDYPKTPEGIGAQADDDYITGFTQADRQQIRDEVLSTTVADIRSYADMIEAIMTKNHYCVFGNEGKVKEAAEIFDKLTPVFKQD